MISSMTPAAAVVRGPGNRGMFCRTVTGATASESSVENTRLKSRGGVTVAGTSDTGGGGGGASALALRSTNPAASVLMSSSGGWVARDEMSGSDSALNTHLKPTLAVANSPRSYIVLLSS